MTVSGIGAAGVAATYSPTPTITSTTANLSTADAALANGVEGSSVSPSAPQPGIAVTLGSVPTADTLYTKLASAMPTQLTWAKAPSDDISRLMEKNLKAHASSGDLSSLFSGLGSQVWNDFLTTQSDFHQSGVVYRPGYADAGSAAATATANTNALQNAKSVQNNIGLKIYTASGKEVDIAITFGGDGNTIQDSLSIDVHTSDSLSLAEQAAITKLSKGLDAALQGIGKDSAEVDLSGLVSFDSKVLASVDLNIRAAPQSKTLQSLDLHVDTNRRSFAMQSQVGKVSVSVDLSSPAPLGSATQQQTAVQHYLEQFDAAGQRGHGDTTLLSQFKDAFAQLHSPAPTARQQPSAALFASRLSVEDRGALSGLADFQASISGDFSNGSTYGYTTEAGHLNYQVSQTTQTRGADKNSGLSVIQTQTAALDSMFAKSRSGMLDIDTGNYDIYRINDNSSTTTSFEYADDKLKNASVVNLLNQSENYQKLENHKVVASNDTPYSTFTVEDISKQLQPA